MTIRQRHFVLIVVFLMVLGGCGGSNDSNAASDPESPGSNQQADPVSGQDLGDFPTPGPGVGSAALASDSDELSVYTIASSGEF